MIILPSYVGIIICHYKDSYKPTSRMESNKVFFFVAHLRSYLPVMNRMLVFGYRRGAMNSFGTS